MNRYLPHATAAIFLFVISVPLALFLLGERGEPIQNRRPTERPPLNVETLFDTEATEQLGDYLRENLPLREDLVAIDARIDRRLGDSPSPDVILGRGNWLFLEQSKSQVCVDRDGASAIADDLTRAHEIVAATGRRLVMAVAPDKPSIYGEHLREDFPCSQQTAEHLQAIATGSGLVAGWDLLREAKGDSLLYFEGDTHWTSLGATVFTQALVNAIAPGAWDPDAVTQRGVREEPGDLTVLIGDPSVEPEPEFETLLPGAEPPVFETLPATDRQGNPVPGAERSRWIAASPEVAPVDEAAVMMHDSFGWAVLPLLAPYFDRIDTVRDQDPAAAHASQAIEDAETIIWLVTQRSFYPNIALLDTASQLAAALRSELPPVQFDVQWDGAIGRVAVDQVDQDRYVVITLAPGSDDARIRVNNRERVLSPLRPHVGVLSSDAGIAFELLSGDVEISAVSVPYAG